MAEVPLPTLDVELGRSAGGCGVDGQGTPSHPRWNQVSVCQKNEVLDISSAINMLCRVHVPVVGYWVMGGRGRAVFVNLLVTYYARSSSVYSRRWILVKLLPRRFRRVVRIGKWLWRPTPAPINRNERGLQGTSSTIRCVVPREN